ncbi:site-specific integrase [Aliiruegeria sabulilitoris]|uniref:site-specific integrase n=1 Tax=Aliiruegeria sabulilitoris TaxID=1510458 RepID=UPI000832EAA2|nr:tyrosine-type recombinase/integrase [Aliiruegeria sabulilitoris]NDR56160.1 tyrosine-type recombinase/integrase [Pseudoruegeria sp. M32A2M]
MALVMKLPNVTVNKGKYVYRRRFPVDLASRFPVVFFQTRFLTQDLGAAFLTEHATLTAAFERLVEDARAGRPEALGKAGIDRYIAIAQRGLDDPRTQRERWHSTRDEAEALVRSVQTADAFGFLEDGGDTARREVLADELERTNADPLLFRAVVQPDAPPPPPTIADAVRVYEKEKLGRNPKKSARDTFRRVQRRLEESLGPLDSFPLEDLKRRHAREVRDYLLAAPSRNGGTLAPSSVRRELNSITALFNVGINELELKGKVENPFSDLGMPADAASGEASEWEKRDPLPNQTLVDVRRRVLAHVRIPELRLIWRLLQATGCRGAEITGLRLEDLGLDYPLPHIWVRWHPDRRVKTKTAQRPVPLIGDGLSAARAAVAHASKTSPDSPFLFQRYCHEGGPDAASGALMSHVRIVTEDPRHVVYSLRHNVKSWLGQSGAHVREENRILGHAGEGVGNRVYGGLDDRLKTTAVALEAALALAPDKAWDVP